jgi:hypothetical protein
MNSAELRDLIQRGWGIHSWSHEIITEEMLARELLRAWEVIEKAIQTHRYTSTARLATTPTWPIVY